jgi:Ca2+-transporting ATPase
MEGLTTARAHELLKLHGNNILPRATVPSIFWIFIKQFFSPLIYILLVAALISMMLGELSTGIFILILLCLNSIIGAIQERSAHKAVISLQNFIPNYSHALRDGAISRMNSEDLVPGDIIFLTSGNKIPADVVLLETNNLMLDESLLTGESLPINKIISSKAKDNQLFAGTLIIKGRATARVMATGLNTKLGAIAKYVAKPSIMESPLTKRIKQLTLYLSIATIIFITGFSVFALLTGGKFSEIFSLATALAVAAVPEGLPTSITVILAVGVHRMSKKNVMVRKLLAVESLGSCTYIVSDKTGTLTKNALSAEAIALPDGSIFNVHDHQTKTVPNNLIRLITTGVLANEAHSTEKEFSGDLVDIAFLELGKIMGITRDNLFKKYKNYKFIPYESETKFAASIYSEKSHKTVFVKGEYESIVKMCSSMETGNKTSKLDREFLTKQAYKLASLGYKAIALASGVYSEKDQLAGLCFLGIVGIADQLRPEAKAAIHDIENASVKVAIVTGDHPITALTIARNLGMEIDRKDIVTGEDLKAATKLGQDAVEKLIRNKKVFAQIEPLQKKTIVAALMRMGHYVAVTGDGVNDAPALKYATIGVAMGKEGTDIARDSADIILTDNNFTSIVTGIIHGRVVYNNIRKVIFLLISTGVAELFIFLLALLFTIEMPLLAIQVLWLNIIVNGIQDKAIGFEPVEGDELNAMPRSPTEPIFNKFMTGRIFVVGLYIGGISFLAFYFLRTYGYNIEQSRSLTLLLFVLFGNIQSLISKSETKSITWRNLLNNKYLFFGIIIAQTIHILTMHIPFLQTLFHVSPANLAEWGTMLVIASSLFFVEAAYRRFHYARLSK